MKCLICGRVNLPGATLCLDCKSARKRAFDATVTQPLLAAAGAARGSVPAARLLKPSQSVPDAARRAAKMALARGQLNTVVETPPSRTGRWPIMVGALCVFVVGVAYFGQRSGSGKSDPSAAGPTERPAAESTAAPLVVPAAPAPSAVPPSSVAAVPVGINAPHVEPTPTIRKTDIGKRASARSKVEKAPLPAPAPEPPPPPQAVVVAPPPPPAIVREPPRADPWQPMNDAIARCAVNDIFGRLSCEQRVRARYCEGHWGQVPQCASIPYVDHGQ